MIKICVTTPGPLSQDLMYKTIQSGIWSLCCCYGRIVVESKEADNLFHLFLLDFCHLFHLEKVIAISRCLFCSSFSPGSIPCLCSAGVCGGKWRGRSQLWVIDISRAADWKGRSKLQSSEMGMIEFYDLTAIFRISWREIETHIFSQFEAQSMLHSIFFPLPPLPFLYQISWTNSLRRWLFYF